MCFDSLKVRSDRERAAGHVNHCSARWGSVLTANFAALPGVAAARLR